MLLYTPLEQFQVLSFFSFNLFYLDLSFTNIVLITFFVFIFLFAFVCLFSSYDGTFYIVPNNWQIILETLYEVIAQLLFDNISTKGEIYFPFIITIFLFIMFSNLIGLVPYSFTITSHIIITFTLSLTIFIGVNIISISIYKLKMLSLFIPANTSIGLAFLLVPIEFISYIFKPISLGVRLFANLMAGHTLLKVIVGFSWTMVLLNNIVLSILHVFPLLVLILLFGLELGVALIQAYVFTILSCIYLNESINLH
jgi:F-type H+-transporting ATPase subunit a